MQLGAPPALGSTYTLDVTNLAGGFAAMAIGFGQQAVPLQPFGLGFGPTCTAHVTTDAVVFLPQSGGLATWSLAIPNVQWLSGVNMFQQVVEIAATSAVSNAVHAQLH